MYNALQSYVRIISHINRVAGTFAMYLVLVMMGLLLYSSFSKVIDHHPIWLIEMAQFMMVAYYLLGGGYSLQMDAHVRMDVFYGQWSPKTQALTDAVTVLCLLFYLGVLLYGAVSSTTYAIEYGQTNYSSWAPPMAPIKLIMTLGILLMLLQVLASFFQNVATVLGKPFALPELAHEAEDAV